MSVIIRPSVPNRLARICRTRIAGLIHDTAGQNAQILANYKPTEGA